MQTAIGILGVVFALRLALGWARAVRWAPEGDPLLVATLAARRPRVPVPTACVTVDLGDPDTPVRAAYVRCDGRTPFEIGSVTKALTGLLLADAVQRGELRLDTRLAEVLPELAGRPAGEATLDALARHRAGLPSTRLGRAGVVRLLLNAYAGLDPYRGLGAPAVLRLAGRARLRAPGIERYSNLGAALTGQAIARRAGLSFPDLVAERLARPLGLPSTSADPRAPRRAGRTALGAWSQPWRLDGYGPAGGVTSTPDDLARLMTALLERTAPGMSALDDGLFWQTSTTPDGRRRIWHNGETGGASAYLAIYPQARRAVAVVAARADAAGQERLAAVCAAALIRTGTAPPRRAT